MTKRDPAFWLALLQQTIRGYEDAGGFVQVEDDNPAGLTIFLPGVMIADQSLAFTPAKGEYTNDVQKFA